MKKKWLILHAMLLIILMLSIALNVKGLLKTKLDSCLITSSDNYVIKDDVSDSKISDVHIFNNFRNSENVKYRNNSIVISNPTKFMNNIKEVSGFYDHFMALKNNNTLWAWGSNISSQLGLGKDCSVLNSSPVRIHGKYIDIGGSNNTSLAINEQNNLYIWGQVSYNEDYEYKVRSPKMILGNVEEIPTMNGDFCLIKKKDNSVYGWSTCEFQSLGNYLGYYKKPSKMMDNVKEAYGFYDKVYFITTKGELFGLGKNDNCSLSYKINKKEVEKPVKIDMFNGSAIKKISFNNYIWDSDNYSGTGAAVLEDGSLMMWGENFSGLIYNSEERVVKVPLLVMKDVQDVSIGEDSCLILKKDGSVWGWGKNANCELGHKGVELTKPTKIMDNVKTIQNSGGVSYLITRNGNLYLMGTLATYDSDFEGLDDFSGKEIEIRR